MATDLGRVPCYDSRGRRVQRKLIRCDCGEEVLCELFTNTCDGCGADYNMAGQRLGPREHWGEETGEHPTDVANLTGEEDFGSDEPW